MSRASASETSVSLAPTMAMVAATLLWGATFVVIRDALHGIAPVILVFTRFAAATLVFAALLAVRRRVPDRTAWMGGILSGVLGAAGFLAQAIGLTQSTAGTSAFLTSTGTLFAGIFAWILLRQRPGAALTFGIALAMAGSALIGATPRLGIEAGALWTLAGALAFGLQVVTLARFAPRTDSIALAGVQSLTVAVVLSPASRGTLGALATLTGSDWWRLGYLSIGGSVVAALLQIQAQRSLSAGRTGLLMALEPVFALLFAIGVGGETFVARWWWGAALILFAVLIVEWRAAQARPGSHAPRS